MAGDLKIGIIGLGNIGKVHANAYAAVDGAEIAAVCDVLPERRDEQGRRFGAAAFADYRDLLRTDVNAVSICVGNALHREVALAALEAGKHILLEKPMAMNARESADILAAGERCKRVIQIGMHQRQSAEARMVRDMIARGVFGELYHIRAVMIRHRGIPGLGGWFTTKAASGGGPLIDLGVHWFDLAMYLSGWWRPTRAAAVTYAKFGRDMQRYRYAHMWAGPPKLDGVCDVEDYAAGLVRFEGGTSMSFEIAWAANAQRESFVELLGDRAGVRLLDGKPLTVLTEYDDHPAEIKPLYAEGGDRYQRQVASFLAACRGEAAPAATAAQGLAVMRLIDAVYASSEQNREVDVEA